LAVFLVILLIGSAVIKYPDVIPAPIVLTGSIPPATVVAHASGKIKKLYIGDNQEIKSGDYLAVIDNPAQTEDILFLKNYLDTLSNPFSPFAIHLSPLSLGSLQQLYTSFSTTLFEYTEYKRLSYYPQKLTMTKERISQYEIQYKTLLNQQQITGDQLIIVQKQYNRDSLLNRKGVISDEELETAKNAFLQSRGSYENMRSNLNNMRIQIGQLKESLLDTEEQGTEKLNSLQTQLQSLISQLKAGIQDWELSYVLKSPIYGKITFSQYWIENQNVSSGEEVFTIVPDSSCMLIGKAQYLPNMQGQADIITEDLSLLERLVLPLKKILKEN